MSSKKYDDHQHIQNISKITCITYTYLSGNDRPGDKMLTTRDLMTAKPIHVSVHTNIHKARMLMAEHKLRHLPVKDIDTGKTVGIVNQKRLLKHAIAIVSKQGFDKLEHQEKSENVESIMNDQPMIFDINAQLLDIAKSLRELKSGCICIEENNQLVGVITSSDFIKLAIAKLEK
ncbi:CBS domain-containing protein [Aliikangiella marina]|uniref:CBS domain-containing protein n=1 Tax=Aliikangiella marina TaxID=1712262 RepID=A0A545T2W5_9GAMM|nr:CBS domain-containing protein [Aliikangiella marina]TQV71567.1 CBS domain-containing protein [Aliikangiella marina]